MTHENPLTDEAEEVQIRIHGDADLPTLVYLPGLHGDWTLVTSFRCALANLVRVVEITYPQTITFSLEDYTRAVEAALLAHGITHAWVLGESWGSQIAWKLVERNLSATTPPPNDETGQFRVAGLIFAGGFVKHPWPWGPVLLNWIGRRTPKNLFRLELKMYALYARFRHRHAPETLASIAEFVKRRTTLDRQAMSHRLRLLATYDPGPTAHKPSVCFQPFVAPLLNAARMAQRAATSQFHLCSRIICGYAAVELS